MEYASQLEQLMRSAFGAENWKLYPASCRRAVGGVLFMADCGDEDQLFFVGGHCPFPALETRRAGGEQISRGALDHESACALRRLFPFTAPQKPLGHARSFGTGDRLGIATLGHIRAIERYDAFPVFAQQSMRELSLTGRTYRDIIDRVTFQVFQTGYEGGYGADGDHLKTAEDIRSALDIGCTMITLDCSEHIRMPAEMPADVAVPQALRERYLSGPVTLAGSDVQLAFTEDSLKEAVWVYGEALDFIQHICATCMDFTRADLEISIDETETPTTPEQHYFVANELQLAAIPFKTMAPRFCGEFQKGIDYIGSVEQFEKELVEHAAIARALGYKLSIHSGSDKFAVYPAIGRQTRGAFHVKTAGTSWLEAMLLVARVDPALFREIYAYAVSVYPEARAYYHVSTELSQLPDLDAIPDGGLPELLRQVPSRQLIHITYGKILQEWTPDGAYRFRDRLFGLWRAHREAYAQLLDDHLSRHLSLLFGGGVRRAARNEKEGSR